MKNNGFLLFLWIVGIASIIIILTRREQAKKNGHFIKIIIYVALIIIAFKDETKQQERYIKVALYLILIIAAYKHNQPISIAALILVALATVTSYSINQTRDTTSTRDLMVNSISSIVDTI